jgi:hypothetical protein
MEWNQVSFDDWSRCVGGHIATDTIKSNVPAIDGGQKYAQIVVGAMLLLTNFSPLKSISTMFPSVLSDDIIDHDAPAICTKTKEERM